MKTSKLLLLLPAVAAMLLTVGCATNEQFVRFPDQQMRVENPEMGRIYVMRPTSFGAVASMEIWDGNRHIGNTGPTSFLCWEREPGMAHIVGREENASSVDVEVKTNQVYYIFQHVQMGWLQPRNKLELVDEAEGAKILKECNPPKVYAAKP